MVLIDVLGQQVGLQKLFWTMLARNGGLDVLAVLAHPMLDDTVLVRPGSATVWAIVKGTTVPHFSILFVRERNTHVRWYNLVFLTPHTFHVLEMFKEALHSF